LQLTRTERYRTSLLHFVVALALLQSTHTVRFRSWSPHFMAAPGCHSTREAFMALTAPTFKIAQIVELGGVAAFVIGIILSVHHYAIGAFFVAGIAAFAVGYKLRQY
jgi:hypothetical protein